MSGSWHGCTKWTREDSSCQPSSLPIFALRYIPRMRRHWKYYIDSSKSFNLGSDIDFLPSFTRGRRHTGLGRFLRHFCNVFHAPLPTSPITLQLSFFCQQIVIGKLVCMIQKIAATATPLGIWNSVIESNKPLAVSLYLIIFFTWMFNWGSRKV